MHYVYFLQYKNGHTYTGSTSDLKRRYVEHMSGKVVSTKGKITGKLIGYESYCLKSDAIRREKYLKTTEGKRFFRQQYRDILTN